MPLPVPKPAGCGGISARADSLRAACGSAGSAATACCGAAEANLVRPDLTCTVLTLTGFIGSVEPGMMDIGWLWITPEVIGEGSTLVSLGGAGGSAAVASASAATSLDVRLGAGAAGVSGAADAISTDPWSATSRPSASSLRTMAAREPPLRPPSTTPTRKLLPLCIDVTRLKPEARV